MFGADLAISDGNDAFCRITGYGREELIGMSLGDVTHPADVALDFERTQRVFSGQVPNYRAEKRCLTKDGETVWTSFTATVVRDDAGRPLYGLGIVEDISERKRIEAIMVRQNERLSTDLETRWPNCSSPAPASSRRRTWSGGGSSATSTTARSSVSSRCAYGSAWPKTSCGTTRCAAAHC